MSMRSPALPIAITSSSAAASSGRGTRKPWRDHPTCSIAISASDGCENPLSLKYFPIECGSVSGRNTRGVRSYDQKVEFGCSNGLRDCGAHGRDDWMGGG